MTISGYRLDAVYTSPRLLTKLNEIPKYPITTVVAPMGYGKTTTVTDFLSKREKVSFVLRYTVISDSLNDFWNGLCNTMRPYGELSSKMKSIGFPETMPLRRLFSEMIIDELLRTRAEVYLIIDDLHLLNGSEVANLILLLVKSLTHQVHFILVSRNRIFKQEDLLLSGIKLNEIGKIYLELKKEETRAYWLKCGITLSDAELDALHVSTEGWMALSYLNLKYYAENGCFLVSNAGIFNIIENVLYKPLSEKSKRFLITLSVMEEFTGKQAVFMWGSEEALRILDELCSSNAFISYQSGTDTYRLHNLLHTYILKVAACLPETELLGLHSRYGDLFISESNIPEALKQFRLAKDYDKMLKTIADDRGRQINYKCKDELKRWLENCPEEKLLAHPQSLLILMCRYFVFGELESSAEMNAMFVKSLSVSTDMSEGQRRYLMCGYELCTSTLYYNDLDAMGEKYKKAFELRNDPGDYYERNFEWTFGSPSLLTLYHRESGKLAESVKKLYELLPTYYSLTNFHGYGAEYLFEAEWMLNRLQFADAAILVHKALRCSEEKRQFSVYTNATFILFRIKLWNGKFEEAFDLFIRLKKRLADNGRYTLLYTLDLCSAWVDGLLKRDKELPAWIAAGDLKNTSLLHLALPTVYITHNQVLICRGEFAELIARKEELEAMIEKSNNVYCMILFYIQLSSAYNSLSMQEKSVHYLERALELAVPDEILLPFAENWRNIVNNLIKIKEYRFASEIDIILKAITHIRDYMTRVVHSYLAVTQKLDLSDREHEIAMLAANRKSNVEIAADLNISERTVKFHLTQIFQKLNIEGNGKNKRYLLEQFFRQG